MDKVCVVSRCATVLPVFRLKISIVGTIEQKAGDEVAAVAETLKTALTVARISTGSGPAPA